jgi:hypothetical protein
MSLELTFGGPPPDKNSAVVLRDGRVASLIHTTTASTATLYRDGKEAFSGWVTEPVTGASVRDCDYNFASFTEAHNLRYSTPYRPLPVEAQVDLIQPKEGDQVLVYSSVDSGKVTYSMVVAVAPDGVSGIVIYWDGTDRSGSEVWLRDKFVGFVNGPALNLEQYGVDGVSGTGAMVATPVLQSTITPPVIPPPSIPIPPIVIPPPIIVPPPVMVPPLVIPYPTLELQQAGFNLQVSINNLLTTITTTPEQKAAGAKMIFDLMNLLLALTNLFRK